MTTTDSVIAQLQTIIKQQRDAAAAELFMVLRNVTGLQVQWSDVTVVPDASDGSFLYLGYRFVPRPNYGETGIAAVVQQRAVANRGPRYSLAQPGYVEIETPGDLLRVLQEFEPWSE